VQGAVGAAALAVLGYAVLCILFPFPQEMLERAGTGKPASVVLDRKGNPLRTFLAPDDSRMFRTELAEISPRLIQATIAVEDKRFYRHRGVDPLAVMRAVRLNLTHGRIVSGASTLTMQVMRLLEDRPRTFASKAVEAFRAVQLESLRDKEAILEIYLNLAPYGGNLIGAEAASRGYFGKAARDLTLGEAALLAGLPQSPSRFRPDRHPERARKRREHVLERMSAAGSITESERARACAEPVRARRPVFPFEAPHLARMVRRMSPRCHVLRTTLDRRIQGIAETAIREQVDRLRGDGVSNGAVVVIENETGAVRALVGSCDFLSEADHGQVNGAMAPRSPGSALKPFTYALALERGHVTPDTVLHDVPCNYTGYEPENYDHRYRGPVTAREALSISLNVPAVKLMNRVGHQRLHGLLEAFGISTLGRGPDHYGLALTLGAAEVTLLELTNAYAALARLGVHRPYRLLEIEPVTPGRRVLSEGAAYLTADILSDTDRLGGRVLWKSDKSRVRMAWKTGTSYGHRDAWTIAFTPKVTVGVWLGNFSGRGAKALVGIEAAAPVAARILDPLHAGDPAEWYAMPDAVGRRSVCVVSGMPKGEHCSATKRGLHLKGRSSRETCRVHTAITKDAETGDRLCVSCRMGRPHRETVVESWPPEVAAWLRRHGETALLAPPHNPRCTVALADGSGPRILSPTDGATYVLTESPAAHQKLALKAHAATEGLYWFIDGDLYRTAGAGDAILWPLAAGRHRITCADEGGGSATVTIDVKF